MSDVPEDPKRTPGAQPVRPELSFPGPWPLPPASVPGWFCPTEDWPSAQPDAGWPGRDLDTDDENGAGE